MCYLVYIELYRKYFIFLFFSSRTVSILLDLPLKRKNLYLCSRRLVCICDIRYNFQSRNLSPLRLTCGEKQCCCQNLLLHFPTAFHYIDSIFIESAFSSLFFSRSSSSHFIRLQRLINPSSCHIFVFYRKKLSLLSYLHTN